MLRKLFKDISLPRSLAVLAASACLAFGLYNVHAQADVTEGGVLGLSLFFDQVLHISPSITATALNILCYLFGFRVLGRHFIVYSAVATAGFSLSYAIFEQLPPIFPEIAAYPLLAAVAGAVFVGIGCGICVRAGGAPSGDDALAMALSHKLRIGISWVYLASDLTVLSLSLIYIPLKRILYSLLTVILSGQIIEIIQKIGRKSKMPNYKIIATDLDGTLLNSQKQISAENLRAIDEMTKMGVYVVPSSGRTLGEIPECVRGIESARYIIHSDGAVIYDNKKNRAIDTRNMKGESARRALDIFYSYETLLTVRANGILYVDADEQRVDIYDSYRMPRSYQPAMLQLAEPVKGFKEFCYGLDEIEMICTFFKHDEELAACRDRLLADGAYGVAATEVTNIELYDKEAGKGNALWRLADLIGVERAKTIAVGDNVNDLDNLSHAGLSLAMENAVEEVKRVSHRTICHNDEHAMKYILENILITR